MAISESKNKADKKWHNANYATLSVKLPKSDIVFSLLDKATQATNTSKAQYVRNALLRQFQLDHIIEDTQLNADQPGRLDSSNSQAAGLNPQSDTMQYLLENKRQRELNYQRLLELEEEQKEMPWYDGD